VGGFASSPALVQHLRQGLAGRRVQEVVVPTHANAAVVKGERSLNDGSAGSAGQNK
jgi:hypothetical protein